MRRAVAAAILAIAAVELRAEERPVLVAGAGASEVPIDGLLDEPAWAAAATVELVMVEPRPGARPRSAAASCACSPVRTAW